MRFLAGSHAPLVDVIKPGGCRRRSVSGETGRIGSGKVGLSVGQPGTSVPPEGEGALAEGPLPGAE